MIAGHPFKGGRFVSTGYLQHPDMKKFGISDSSLFVPPNPAAWATFGAAAASASAVPSFGDFFSTYFAGKSFNVYEPKCHKMLEGMKRCFENNSENPTDTCQFYIQGFERMACGQ